MSEFLLKKRWGWVDLMAIFVISFFLEKVLEFLGLWGFVMGITAIFLAGFFVYLAWYNRVKERGVRVTITAFGPPFVDDAPVGSRWIDSNTDALYEWDGEEWRLV